VRTSIFTAQRALSSSRHPDKQHICQWIKAKLGHLTRVVKRLFDFDLFLDTVGVNLLLRMGTPDVRPYLVSDFDPKYDHAVAALPQVQAQGDGIKSALGLLVPLISDFYPLVLLDEPEAHLHPPQARIIGVEIGNQARDNGSQVIVSTHDKNIVQGIVESEAPVTILHSGVRVTPQVPRCSTVRRSPSCGRDPILRYSNALDGLFHAAVVIAEGERDAHFYNAAIDYVQSVATPERPADNLIFLGTSGKTNIARIATRLHKLGVRTVSCPDLDILDNETVLRPLVAAHRGNWDELADDYKRATAEFRNVPNAPAKADVRKAIIELIDETSDQTLTESLATAITKAVKIPSTRWSALKDGFVAALKNDRAAATRLLDKLDELGIVTVKVGVLENFVTTATAPKGPEFLPVSFAEKAHTQQPAVDHANRLLKAAGIN
jgi:AAA domain, putative AbiEii toxin, Type IV TA system